MFLKRRPISKWIKRTYRTNALRIKIALLVMIGVVIVSVPVMGYLLWINILDRSHSNYDYMQYRSIQMENEVRRAKSITKLDAEHVENMLDADERVYIENTSTGNDRYIDSDKPPPKLSKVEKNFSRFIIGMVLSYYKEDVKTHKIPLRTYQDKKTGFMYAVYTHNFKHDDFNDRVYITRNVTSVVTKPLGYLLQTINFVFPFYLLSVALLSFWAVSLVFRILGKAIDNGLDKVEETNYTSRIPITGKYGKEITSVKMKINDILERMEYILKTNIDSMQEVSHEVNTHLTAMKQSVDIIKRYGEKNKGLSKAMVESIDEHIQRTTSIMTTILELAKLEQGIDSPACERLNVKELIESFLLHYRKSYPDFTFVTIYDKEDMEILIDREHFYLAIKPIIENAVRYSRNHNQISIHLQDNYCPNSLHISVKNRGVGIKEEDIPYLFERNYRGDTGIKQGSGLGLAITKKVMDLYKGDTCVESQPGKETIFTLIFPNKKVS